MLIDDELWEKCNTNQPITAGDLGIKENTQGLVLRDATKEEIENVNRYVESISKPTGVSFYDTETTYRQYELNLEKVNSIDDCKKILKFLCELTIKPLPSNVEYGGFGEVSEYFIR